MKFYSILIKWYETNKRDLPWRDTCDPYKIWLSEIILQQTRVNQGLSYYLKFIENFPDVVSLANATEEQVLKLWQGLGYYSRARNLHYTAKIIRDKYKGVFPADPEEIAALKGIGEYTTAAISSFAFGIPLAAVDGNVVRVLSRYFNINIPFDTTEGKRVFRELANNYIDKKAPGTYNQAIMEFGAVQCKPVNPDCISCPLNNGCMALATGNVDNLPAKKKQVKLKKRNFNYLINNNFKKIQIRQRNNKDIWQNLYEFPLIETENKLSKKQIENKLKTEVSLAANYVHKLSHREINANFWLVNDLKPEYLTSSSGFIQTNIDDLQKYPISRLMDRFIKEVMLTVKSE